MNCHACGAPFDALKASWCACIGQDRTLVCPSCGECSCRAPRDHRQRFWAAASARLREMHARAVEDLPALRPNPPSEAARRPLVLVVEDQAAVVRLAMRAVDALGYGVVHAQDGLEGLDLARHYNPDLVVTDALLPGLDGRELCRALKQDPDPPRVVVMSGVYTSPRHASEARHVHGADDYLAKPFSFATLQQVVRRFLEGADRRSFARHACHVTVTLERLDENAGGEPSEITVTENLGRGGALLRTTLPVNPGEVVALRQLGGRFRAQGIVKQVSIGADGRPRLHVQFKTVVGLDAVLPAT